MRVRELRDLAERLGREVGDEAFVFVHGQEYHLTGAYERQWFGRHENEVVAVDLQTDLGGGPDFHDACDAVWRKQNA